MENPYGRRLMLVKKDGTFVQLDETDVALLTALQEDARLSYRDLAERVGVSTPTVSARVKRLEDLGVIRGYRAIVGDGLRGDAVHVVRVRARPADLTALVPRVGDLQGVEEVLLLSGGVLEARVRLRDGADVADLLRALGDMPEVQEYEERRVLDLEVVAAPRSPPVEVDVRCHECKGPIHGAPTRKRLGDREHVFCCRNCLGTFEARWDRHQHATGPA